MPKYTELSEADAESLAKAFISYLPWIIYNDDFADNPPSDIAILNAGNQQNNVNPEWYEIYETVFEKCESSEYALSEIAGIDPDKRKGLLSDVYGKMENVL